MVAPPWGAHMARNPLATMEYLYRLSRDADIDLLLDQGEGDGIPGTVDFDAIVRGHAGALQRAKTWGSGGSGCILGRSNVANRSARLAP